MTTGFWFQRARGRAIVRSKAMSRARFWKRVAGYDRERQRDYLRRDAGMDMSYPFDAATLAGFIRDEITRSVRRARRAHTDWRKYRGLHLSEEAPSGRDLGD